VRDIYGETVLFWVDNPDIIKILIENGANPNIQNQNGYTPLMKAVQFSDQEKASILLDLGADPNISNKQGLYAIDFARDSAMKSMLTRKISQLKL